MKKFFLMSNGTVGSHKSHKTPLVGMGILHPDQMLEVTTVGGTAFKFEYSEVKVSGHLPRLLVTLNENDTVDRVYITKNTKTVVNNIVSKL